MRKIEEIKSKLSPESIRSELDNMMSVPLPQNIQKWVDEYVKAGGVRSNIIWPFTYCVIKNVSPFVDYDKSYEKDVEEAKFLFSMFVVIIDDIADLKKDSELLEEIYKAISNDNYLGRENLDTLSTFALDIFRHINKKIANFPFYSDFKNILSFEIDQIFNSMRFAILVSSHPFLISAENYWTYFPCSMQMMLYNIMELMAGNGRLTPKELKEIRDIILKAQKMGRIGNWISTWEREIDEKDLTSLIFAYALDSNILDVDNLEAISSEELIAKIKRDRLEEKLMNVWDECYKDISGKKDIKDLIEIRELGQKLEKLLILQIVSKS